MRLFDTHCHLTDARFLLAFDIAQLCHQVADGSLLSQKGNTEFFQLFGRLCRAQTRTEILAQRIDFFLHRLSFPCPADPGL